MAEYIEREALLTKMKKLFSKEELKVNTSNDIARAAILLAEYEPTSDVTEVRRGKWIDVPINMAPEYFAYKYNLRTKCSACGFCMPYEYPRYNICPNCGAKMDLEE